ncbi:MAG: hypothetical protein MAG451_01795 [Anaerolineales bacterium]|nr:hypothetical protein [Anaerolineales bacterium]
MQAVMLIRDIAIIVLALVSIVVGILMVLLILEIRNLVTTLQRDVQPILGSMNETASTVKGTTDFVSERVVRPIASAIGAAAGTRNAFAALLGRDPSTRRE